MARPTRGTPDGSKLLVPLNLADAAAIVDTATGATTYVKTGSYPYGAAITPDGATGLVTNEAAGTVSFVDLAAGVKTGDVALGHLTHPEGITIDAQGRRAYVAVANDDRVAVIDLATRTPASSWSTSRSRARARDAPGHRESHAWPNECLGSPDDPDSEERACRH